MPSHKYHTLGTNVIPIHYNLAFEPDLEKFVFSCNEIIDIEVKKKTKVIRLNAKELKITKAQIDFHNTQQKCKIKYDKENEEVILSFKNAINGKVKILLEFVGTNTD